MIEPRNGAMTLVVPDRIAMNTNSPEVVQNAISDPRGRS
jgi:hypothetical protein